MSDVIFYFDFGSPNAYLAHKVIPGIEKRSGARFVYVPALLGGIFKATGNQSPALAFAGIPSKLAYEAKETRRFVRVIQAIRLDRVDRDLARLRAPRLRAIVPLVVKLGDGHREPLRVAAARWELGGRLRFRGDTAG